MHIKQVVIRGFKTYKEQTALEEDFSPGANAVVGFNGSGKSNFFQAILFVLSDQYSNLRVETRKALLHEGATQVVLTAYVEVVLDNEDRRIPIESNQVSIRRLIGLKKDDWLLDGKHATKAEIFGLLEGAGFAKTSPYYIVQQGKVSELTMMTDAQRLGMLKDISGAGIYDERRAESVRIMEDTAMRRERVEGLVGEIQKKLSSLEEEQKELRDCESLEAHRRTLEYVLADREWRTAQDRIEELTGRHDEASRKLITLQNEAGANQKRLSDLQSTLAQNKVDQDRAQEELTSVEKERDAKFQALSKAHLEVDEQSRKQQENQDQHVARTANMESARADLKQGTAELEELRGQAKGVEEKKRELERGYQVLKTQREQLLAKQNRKQQFGSIKERNAALDEEIKRRSEKLKEGHAKLKHCEEKLKRAEERKGKASVEASARRKDLAAVEAKVSELTQELRRLGGLLDGASEKLRLLHRDRGSASKELESWLERGRTQQNRLENTLPRSYRQAIAAVMRWAAEEGLQERLRGPLLMHIHVAPAFRTAVESFAGMALFNVLAMDDEIAEQAVKMVRTKRLGAVVITPLSQLRVREQQYPQMEGVKPLVDAVQAPDWAVPAVHQIFGRGMACSSMKLCEEVARTYSYDTISLEGDRVSRRGVVTGGYQDPQRLQRLSLAEAIASAHQQAQESSCKLPKIDKDLAEASQELDSLHVQRREFQEERDRLRTSVAQLTEEVQSLEATHGFERDIADLTEWRHRMSILVSECETSIEAKKAERASDSLSGLSPADEQALKSVSTDIGALAANQKEAQEQHQKLRAELEEKEAHVEKFLRKRLQQLELEEAQQLTSSEQAEEVLQVRARLEREHQECMSRVEEAGKKLKALLQRQGEEGKAVEELQGEEQRYAELLGQLSVRIAALSSEMAAHADKKAEVDSQLQRLTAPAAEVEQHRQLPKAQLVRDLAEVNRRLQDFQHVNRKAVEQFENYSEQLMDLQRRKEDIDAGEGCLREALNKIDEQKAQALTSTLMQVNTHFQQVFAEMVPGGVGNLQIQESSGSTSSLEGDGYLARMSGVRIEVSFTGQAHSFVSMGQLSGGQKTVVALSLIFAIQRLEPAPFYLLDEVDAALDASYRSALANVVARTAKTSQVILTTFRPEMLEKADRCYRVYQQNRASRIGVVTREQARQVLREQDRLAELTGQQ